MQNIKQKLQPMENARWNNANIDSLFYAGNQSYINSRLTFNEGITAQQYYFNLVQQPINMVTGRQRQRRKSAMFQAVDGIDPQTPDQYTKIIKTCFRNENIHEKFSKSCELSAIAGLNLMQPYLDYFGDDPAQGTLKLKVWEYNSFMCDAFFREHDMSDANIVWTQEFIAPEIAQMRYGDKLRNVSPVSGNPRGYSDFYFLPENYNMAKNNLLIQSYIWYKHKRKRKKLYSRSRKQFFDFGQDGKDLEALLWNIPDMEEVTVEVPSWKCAVILNDMLMWQGYNPLNFDACPFIPNFWNYDPHLSQYDLRSRSLIFPMRSSQFLFNHKIITNNDIAEATINAGWKRKSGAVANEDNLKRSGQGYDIIINEGYELTDCEKIIPSAVPESDLALAEQMATLINKTSGVDLENWSGQNDKQISSLTMLLKQDASLMIFQKYFDQWDMAFKLVSERCLDIILHNWSPEKIELMIGEEPSAFFYSKLFARYHTVVEEADLTPTQQNLQAQHMLDINVAFQREVFPPSMIIPKLNITGKGEIIPFLQQQEQQTAMAQQEAQHLQQTIEEMKMKELMAKIHNQLSQARERDSRSESNIGLFEERMSMISKNHAMASKEKMDALAQLLETIQKFGEVETFLKANNLESIKYDDEETEKISRQEVERNEASKRFIEQIMSSQPSGQQKQQMPIAM